MSESNESATKYTLPAIVLHWSVAVLVVTLFGIGWYMVDLPKGPMRSEYFALHKSIGITVFLLLALRIAWRARRPPPDLPGSVPRWQVLLARTVHLALYALLIAQPLSGYLSSSFSGYSTRVFGIPLPSWGWHSAPLNELFTEIHVSCSVALLALIGLHLCGVVSHLVSGESGLVRRMLP